MYDFSEFIERIKDRNYPDIISEAEAECYRAESGTSQVKGAVAKRAAGALDYASDLKGLLFFFRYGIKPAGLSDYKFQELKPICDNLVKKQQFKSTILDLFKADSDGRVA